MISILISTKNRPDKLERCLQSIVASSFQNFEIILIDQSNNKDTKTKVAHLQSKKIRYFKMNKIGKAKALNFAIKKSRNELLAFTDDDCIVTKNWLQEIHNSYRAHTHIAGVFGNTYAYKTTNTGKKICAATFKSDKKSFFSNPSIIHYQVLGQGNNMSLKKSVIVSVGMVKEWLGVGSLAKAGEESELIFRILKNKKILMTNPNMVVYHNRWLTYYNYQLLENSYTRGLFAFFAYYFFTSDGKITWRMMTQRVHKRLLPALKKFHHIKSLKNLISAIYLIVNETGNGFYGITLGTSKRILNNL